jgi:ubiquinol oxidase
VFERIVQARAEQDNEQWHLLILQDLVQRRGLKQSLLRHRLAP